MADLDAMAAERVAAVMSPQAALLDLPEVARDAIARRAGRPVGSASRRTEAEARAVIERFGDARLHQVAIATMALAELTAIGLTVKEALEAQRLSFAAVAPYLFKRMPIDVDVSMQRTVNLTIVTGLPGEGEGAAPVIMGVVQNQEVNEGDDGAV